MATPTSIRRLKFEKELLERKRSRLDVEDKSELKSIKKLQRQEESIQEKIERERFKRSKVPLTPPKGNFNVGKLGRSIAGLLAGRGQVISASGGDSGRGRGRPEGTFKTRVLPSGQAVKVPTAVYKKMVSQQKSQMRLQAEIRRARFSAQMPDDPRMHGDGEMDRFLASEDTGESLAMQDAFARQQALEQAQGVSQQGPSAYQRLSMVARRLRQMGQGGQMGQSGQMQQGYGFGAGQGGMMSGYGQGGMGQVNPQGMGLKGEPHVRALGQAELLKVPSTVGFKR